MSWYEPPEGYYDSRCDYPCIIRDPDRVWDSKTKRVRLVGGQRCEYLESGEVTIDGKRYPVHYCRELDEFMNDEEARTR